MAACSVAVANPVEPGGPVLDQQTISQVDAALPREPENELKDEQRQGNSQSTTPKAVESKTSSGLDFRFLGASYHFDWAAAAYYLYRFDHERIPTAEAQPRILDQKFITHILHLDLGAAVTNRPWADGQMSIGFRTQQDWHTTHREMTDYLADISSVDAFPFATKLLESDHQAFGWYRHRLTASTFFNLYGAYRVRHEGALRLELQERRTKSENSPRFRSVKWLPSLFVSTQAYGTFMPYLYLVRQQNYGEDALSFETYATKSSSSRSPFSLSFGLRHLIPLGSQIRSQLLTELYRHSYRFNAFYHDYDRLGAVLRLDSRLPFYSLAAGGILSYSVDDFRHKQVVVNSCSFPDGSASSSQTVACKRQDRNIYLSFWAKYYASPSHVWSFRYSNIDSQSNLGRHHDFNEFQYVVGYNYNFDRFYGRQNFSDTQLDRIYGKKAYTYD